MNINFDRKPVFDAVRAILGRGFTQAEVAQIDRAISRAVSQAQRPRPAEPRLGSLSAHFESGGRGAGTVSSGVGDPGGVSYGVYQLSSKAGTVAQFLAREGAAWADELSAHRPGSAGFSAIWKEIAAREAGDFGLAQHDFIRRTHYRPAVQALREQTGLDAETRAPAVRDAVWSVAVQHGRAARILVAAAEAADALHPRDDPAYDRTLIEAIYAQRGAYVLEVAQRSTPAARRTLVSLVRNRYPAELQAALAMLEKDTAHA